MNIKRAQGQFYTRGNPFKLRPFVQWAKKIGLERNCILEPFAGANHIINTLIDVGLCNDFVSYDINPASKDVKKRNTISNFPRWF